MSALAALTTHAAAAQDGTPVRRSVLVSDVGFMRDVLDLHRKDSFVRSVVEFLSMRLFSGELRLLVREELRSPRGRTADVMRDTLLPFLRNAWHAVYALGFVVFAVRRPKRGPVTLSVVPIEEYDLEVRLENDFVTTYQVYEKHAKQPSKRLHLFGVPEWMPELSDEFGDAAFLRSPWAPMVPFSKMAAKRYSYEERQVAGLANTVVAVESQGDFAKTVSGLSASLPVSDRDAASAKVSAAYEFARRGGASLGEFSAALRAQSVHMGTDMPHSQGNPGGADPPTADRVVELPINRQISRTPLPVPGMAKQTASDFDSQRALRFLHLMGVPASFFPTVLSQSASSARAPVDDSDFANMNLTMRQMAAQVLEPLALRVVQVLADGASVPFRFEMSFGPLGARIQQVGEAVQQDAISTELGRKHILSALGINPRLALKPGEKNEHTRLPQGHNVNATSVLLRRKAAAMKAEQRLNEIKAKLIVAQARQAEADATLKGKQATLALADASLKRKQAQEPAPSSSSSATSSAGRGPAPASARSRRRPPAKRRKP